MVNYRSINAYAGSDGPVQNGADPGRVLADLLNQLPLAVRVWLSPDEWLPSYVSGDFRLSQGFISS